MLELQKNFLLVNVFNQISCNKCLKAKVSCFFVCFFCLAPLGLESSSSRKTASFLTSHRLKKYKNLHKRTKIKMSLELFHEVPAGAIETLFDEQNQPLFKRAELGKYLGIRNIGDNFKGFPWHHAHPRSEIVECSLTAPLCRKKNSHDIFINLDGFIETAIRSKKNQKQLS